VYAQAGDDVGRSLKGIGNQIEDHMAIMETSELYKTGTELKLNLQTRYEKESALPENRNNPHFGDQFMAEVSPQLDQWGSGAGTDHGKQLAATLKASIRNEIFNHVAAGQAEMDMAHADDNHTQTRNLLGSGLITDPSEANLRRTLGTMKDANQALTAAIPDVGMRERAYTEYNKGDMSALVVTRYSGVGESIKNQIAETGAETSPALEQLNKDIKSQLGFEYISPEVQTKISALGAEAVKQGQELFKTRDATARRQQDEAVQGAVLEAETAMFKPNGAGGVTVESTPDLLDAMQRIARMPGAERHADDIRALGNALHTATQDQISGKERVTNHDTYMSLFTRVGSTTNPLTKAEVDLQVKNLSDKDWQFLRTSAADSKLAEPKRTQAMSELNQWLGRIKPMIDKSSIYSGIDQQGTQKFSYFAWDVQNKVRQAIASGEDPNEAVRRLTDPHNPNGFYHFIPQYQTTNKQGLAGVLSAVRPDGVQPIAPVPGGVSHDIPAAQPGESPDAYLKRTHQ
jgi:hypothetical protein